MTAPQRCWPSPTLVRGAPHAAEQSFSKISWAAWPLCTARGQRHAALSATSCLHSCPCCPALLLLWPTPSVTFTIIMQTALPVPAAFRGMVEETASHHTVGKSGQLQKTASAKVAASHLGRP